MQWRIYGGGSARGFHSPKKYLKTSDFIDISNIIILVCLFNKVLKYNEKNIYIYKNINIAYN
jgi:hypothetical protein